MTIYRQAIGGQTYSFDGLKELLARASPERSGDQLAGVAASSAAERVAAQVCLADLPLSVFLDEPSSPMSRTR